MNSFPIFLTTREKFHMGISLTGQRTIPLGLLANVFFRGLAKGSHMDTVKSDDANGILLGIEDRNMVALFGNGVPRNLEVFKC